MKKVFLLFLIASLSGCSNVKTYGPNDEDKSICKENTDTIINHLSEGWFVVDSVFNTDRFFSVTNKDGSRDEFYYWIMLSRISDGRDTLTVITKPSTREEWEGDITSSHFLFSEEIDKIKRHNLAVKSACKDTCFSLSVDDDKVIRATFRKEKPKEPKRPLEDYGLKESDL